MNVIYRKATTEDIELLIKLRLDYLTNDKSLKDLEIAAIRKQLREYIPRELGHSFVAYIAEIDHKTVSTVFLSIAEKPANPSFITGKTATVLNVFTYPNYRKQGIATKLLEMMIEDAKTRNISYLELSATESGKPLYEKLGFICKDNSKYTEMKLRLINTISVNE